MFTQIASLVARAKSVQIILTAGEGDEMEVSIVAAPKTNDTPVVPLAVKATPAELDANFPELLAQFAGNYVSMAEAMEGAAAIMKAAAEQAAKQAAQKAAAKKSSAVNGKPSSKIATPPADDAQTGVLAVDDDDEDSVGEDLGVKDVASSTPAPAATAEASLQLEL